MGLPDFERSGYLTFDAGQVSMRFAWFRLFEICDFSVLFFHQLIHDVSKVGAQISVIPWPGPGLHHLSRRDRKLHQMMR